MNWLTKDLVRTLQGSIDALALSTKTTIRWLYGDSIPSERADEAGVEVEGGEHTTVDVRVGGRAPLLSRFEIEGPSASRAAAVDVLRIHGRCLVEARIAAEAVEHVWRAPTHRQIESAWDTLDRKMTRTSSLLELWAAIEVFVDALVSALVPPGERTHWMIEQTGQETRSPQVVEVLGAEPARRRWPEATSAIVAPLTETGARLHIFRADATFTAADRLRTGDWLERLRLRHARWIRAVRDQASGAAVEAVVKIFSHAEPAAVDISSFGVDHSRVWIFDWSAERPKLFWSSNASRIKAAERRIVHDVFVSGEPRRTGGRVAWPVRTREDGRMAEAIIDLELLPGIGDRRSLASLEHDVDRVLVAVCERAGEELARIKNARRQKAQVMYVRETIIRSPLEKPDPARAASAIARATGAAGALVCFIDGSEMFVGRHGRLSPYFQRLRYRSSLPKQGWLAQRLRGSDADDTVPNPRWETVFHRLSGADGTSAGFVVVQRKRLRDDPWHSFNGCESRWLRQFTRITSLFAQRQSHGRRAAEMLFAAWSEPILIVQEYEKSLRALVWSNSAAELLDLPRSGFDGEPPRLPDDIAEAIKSAGEGVDELIDFRGRRLVVQGRPHVTDFDRFTRGASRTGARQAGLLVRLFDPDRHSPSHHGGVLFANRVRHDAKTPVAVIQDAIGEIPDLIRLLGAHTLQDIPADFIRDVVGREWDPDAASDERGIDGILSLLHPRRRKISRAEGRALVACGWNAKALGAVLDGFDRLLGQRCLAFAIDGARLHGAVRRTQASTRRLAEILELHAVFDRTWAQVAPAVDAVVALYEREAIPMFPDVEPNLPPVRLSSYDIRTVLETLVDNAVRAISETETGTGSVHIQASLDGDEVCVEVRDDGVPIPPELAGSMIFSPFSPLKKGPGGEGLAQVSAIVTGTSGAIDVRTVDTWKVFAVRLPIVSGRGA